MTLAAHIASVLLAAGMLASGSLKLARSERIVTLMSAVGVQGPVLTVLGGLQVAAALGLVAGLWFAPLAIAAATGLVVYFLGAVGAHLRAHDPDWQPAGVLAGLSAVTLTLLLLAL
ncbi:DoxX family protein [Nocardioides acrostichi]|uniref:DoxX family protein n=1 Tax=Nocardioides acrostichi TaxID=2784339 RepID=A0A930V0G3_9ACTN|nr:DoxX family protein [Nocardioides acrostichi]MBF4161445.1 DoxX family protein [Nocardioides acrostichi]